jgi:hypothetical protein
MTRPDDIAEGVVAARRWFEDPTGDPDVVEPIARALLKLHDDNARLHEYIEASKEVATAKDVMWFEEENTRMRAAFQKMVDGFKAGADVQFSMSGCEWCGTVWPRPDGSTIEHIHERAKRHTMTCEAHPLRIERDAWREQYERLAKLVGRSKSGKRAVTRARNYGAGQ